MSQGVVAATDNYRQLWSLRPDVAYLNHGSFGPSPASVIAARKAWIDRLEGDPVDFLIREADVAIAQARDHLGKFLQTSGDHLVFVDNATMGMNIVARSFPLRAGDEVISNDHEYGAVNRLWEQTCRSAGATLKVVELPAPLEDLASITSRLTQAITPRTRLLVVSHVTSPTALIFPAAEICRAFREREIAVCIDGPHAVAMCDLNIDELDCDFYTMSCHKWLCAPFGTGALYVHPRRQSAMAPIVTSWGNPSEGQARTWRDEFHWAGTRDPGAFLSVTAAIDFMKSVGLDEFRFRCHALALHARERLTAELGLKPIAANHPPSIGTMASVYLPAGTEGSLQRRLFEKYRIEIPVFPWKEHLLLRVSCHLYNTADEIERLIQALRKELPSR